MNKLLSAILTGVLLFSFSAIIAQGVCGTSTQTQYEARERLFQNRINAANNPSATSRNATKYVPIRFHIVSKTDGTLGIKEQTIINLLCQINNEYEDQDIVFYIFKNGDEPLFDRINNTAFYEDPGSSAGLNQISQNWSNKAINIYFTKTAGSNPNTLAYYLGPFPGFAKEHIICKNSAADGPTVAHEIGHFFSLAHPFFGWEDNAWDPNVHGNPVGTYAPAGAPFLNEKMDGSNCTIAADGLCDTPPDYLFAFSAAQNGCNPWSGGAMDPNGEIC